MKKILFILIFLISVIGHSQVHGVDFVNFNVKTTAQMNAITVLQGLQNGSTCNNDETDSIHIYNGTDWVDQGPDWANITNIPANLDLDSTDELLKDATNTISSDTKIINSDTAGIVINPGGNGTVNISGGAFATGRVEIIVSENSIEATGYSIADIDAVGNRSLITKEKLDAVTGAYAALFGTNTFNGVNTFEAALDVENGFYMNIAPSVAAKAGAGTFTFLANNQYVFKKSDDNFRATIDINALTANGSLVLTDSGATWKGIDLTAGSGTPDDNSVTSAKILNGTILTEDIAPSFQVDGSNIAAGSITNNSLAVSAVATDKIQDAAITNAKIAPAAVSTDKLVSATDATILARPLGSGTGSPGYYPKSDIKDILDYQALDVDYDNTSSGLTSANTQAAIDELAAGLLGEETATVSRTAVLSDADGLIQITNATDMTYTIPANASVAFDIGTVLILRREGAGNIILAYSGAASGDAAQTYKYGETINVWKTGTDTWEVLNAPVPDYGYATITFSGLDQEFTTGTVKGYYDFQFDATIVYIWATTNAANTGGSIDIIDVNNGGTTIMAVSKLRIDATEVSSRTAATAAVISSSGITAGDRITVDVDQINGTSSGTGGQVTLKFIRL